MTKLPTSAQILDSLLYKRESMKPGFRLVFDHTLLAEHAAEMATGISAAEHRRIRLLLLQDACRELGIDYAQAVRDEKIASGELVEIKPEDAPYRVELRHPRDQLDWGVRYGDLNAPQAAMYYEGINIGRGWQKRLLNRHGAVVCEATS